MNISNEIKEFITDEESNGALLLTGKWGCGKSYLIKQLVNDFNKNEKFVVVVISLFGINSASMLHETIKERYLESNSGLLGAPAQKVYKTLSKLATTGAKISASALPDSAAASAISTGMASVATFNPLNFIAVKNYVGVGDKKRSFALVFDDFEICEISIKTLMGIVNEYSENRGIKTVLVADENKIADVEYSDFTEKLMGRTVKLNPNHSDTIHLILANYSNKDSDYKSFLLANEACLRGAFFS